MKIIRYQDAAGNVHHGIQRDDGSAVRASGELYVGLQPTEEPADIARLLAPIAPIAILAIGLNYRQHAE